MSRDKKDLHNELVKAYESTCEKFKKYYPNLPQPFLTDTFRSDQEQEELFFIGRDKTGKIINKGIIKTNARAGQSPHNYNPSFAFDIAFIGLNKKLDWNPDLFKKFAEIITSDFPNVVWGFDWNGNKIKDKNDFDRPHFELRSWKQFKETKNEKIQSTLVNI